MQKAAEEPSNLKLQEKSLKAQKAAQKAAEKAAKAASKVK